jgi:hypothetical protein
MLDMIGEKPSKTWTVYQCSSSPRLPLFFDWVIFERFQKNRALHSTSIP